MGRELYIPTRKRTAIEAEVSRLIINLNDMPIELLRILTSRQLVVLLKPNLSHETVLNYRQEILKEREAAMGGTEAKGKKQAVDREMPLEQPNPERIGQQIVLERIGNIVSKSYPHLGDNEKVSEADALQMIYRELKQYDASIITRNEKRALPKLSRHPQQSDN